MKVFRVNIPIWLYHRRNRHGQESLRLYRHYQSQVRDRLILERRIKHGEILVLLDDESVFLLPDAKRAFNFLEGEARNILIEIE